MVRGKERNLVRNLRREIISIDRLKSKSLVDKASNYRTVQGNIISLESFRRMGFGGSFRSGEYPETRKVNIGTDKKEYHGCVLHVVPDAIVSHSEGTGCVFIVERESSREEELYYC